MSRPGTRIYHFYQRIASDHYEQIAQAGATKWQEIAESLGDDALVKTTEQLGRVLGHRARLVDKINLYKTLIADAIGKDDGTLTDHDAMLILAGWAREHWCVHRDDVPPVETLEENPDES